MPVLISDPTERECPLYSQGEGLGVTRAAATVATADKPLSQEDGKQQCAAADVDEGVPPQNRSSTSVLSIVVSEGGAASDCSSSSDESHEGQEFDSANLEAMAAAIQARCAHAQVGAPARVPAFVCVCRLGRDRRFAGIWMYTYLPTCVRACVCACVSAAGSAPTATL
eukprot:COSAG01_NODE_48_length_31904_cov_21.696997_10_plen_168_part_00